MHESHLSPAARLAQFRTQLLQLMDDGRLTDHELRQLEHTRRALALTPADVRSLRAEVYHQAFKRAEQDGRISAREAELLDRLVQMLNGGVWLREVLSKPSG